MSQIASVVQEYQAATQGWAVANFDELALLRMEGPDRHSFLQRLLTNDVSSLAPGATAHGYYLTVQGRPLMELFLFESEKETLLLTPREQAQTVYSELDKMHFGEKLRFAIDSECAPLLSCGPGRPQQSAALKPAFPMLAAPHELVLASKKEAVQQLQNWKDQGATEVGPDTLKVLRWEAGRALLSELPEKTMFLEIAHESDYSETKGCYPGQEVVARTLHRGHINKKLCVLHSDQPLQDATIVLKEGKEVGHWLCGGPHPLRPEFVGLGIVRRGFWEPDTVLDCDGARVRVG